MKRILAFLMTAVLMISASLTVYASEDRQTVSGQTVSGQTGQVDVAIGAALLLKSPVTFSVELKDAQGKIQTGEIIIGG